MKKKLDIKKIKELDEEKIKSIEKGRVILKKDESNRTGNQG